MTMRYINLFLVTYLLILSLLLCCRTLLYKHIQHTGIQIFVCHGADHCVTIASGRWTTSKPVPVP